MGAGGASGRKVAVIDSGLKNQDGAQIEDVEQALIMYDDEGGDITVIQPNPDGSYWRKIVRNKVLRMKEQRRVKAAKQWFLDSTLSWRTPGLSLHGGHTH